MFTSNVSAFTVSENSKLSSCLEAFEGNSGQALYIVDDDNNLKGALGNTEIRRSLSSGKLGTDSLVSEIMNRKPICIEKLLKDKFQSVTGSERSQFPVTNDGKIVGFACRSQPYSFAPVFIQSGGLGTRLKHLTAEIPKPMVKVGGQPMLERLIARLVDEGFINIFICVNYLKESITDYFGDGSEFGCIITYIEEENPLGTAGALAYLKDVNFDHVTVINCDVETKSSIARLISEHVHSGSLATCYTAASSYSIPFGIVNEKDGILISIKEKPALEFEVLAGIYCLDKTVIHKLKYERLDMPTLLTSIVNSGEVVRLISMGHDWSDLGTVDQIKKFEEKL